MLVGCVSNVQSKVIENLFTWFSIESIKITISKCTFNFFIKYQVVATKAFKSLCSHVQTNYTYARRLLHQHKSLTWEDWKKQDQHCNSLWNIINVMPKLKLQTTKQNGCNVLESSKAIGATMKYDRYNVLQVQSDRYKL